MEQVKILEKTAMLKGIIRAMLAESIRSPKDLSPATFVTNLNQLLCEQSMIPKIRGAMVHLDANNYSITTVCSGIPPLMHLKQGSKKTEFLESANPPLGAESTVEFSSMNHTWNEGDFLILHTFEQQKSFHSVENFSEGAQEILKDFAMLSPKKCAEELHASFEHMTQSSGVDEKPKTVFCLQKIT